MNISITATELKKLKRISFDKYVKKALFLELFVPI